MSKVAAVFKTSWEYLKEGVDWLAGFISRHPRKTAVVLVVYVSYRLFSLVF
jgi:hypothetical protein